MRQFAVSLLLSSLLLAGCSTTPHQGSTAPGKSMTHPGGSQATAHAQRQVNEHGLELVYDPGLEVFVLADISDIYFNNHLYLRYSDQQWQATARIGEPWRVAKYREVPVKLRKAMQQARPASRLSQSAETSVDLLSLIK